VNRPETFCAEIADLIDFTLRFVFLWLEWSAGHTKFS